MRQWVLIRRDPNTGKIEYMTDASGWAHFSDDIYDASKHRENRVLKAALTKAKKRHGWQEIYDQVSRQYIPDTTPWEYSVVEVEVRINVLMTTQVKL